MRILSQVRLLMVAAAALLALPLVGSVAAQQEKQQMEVVLATLKQQWEVNSRTYAREQEKLQREADKIRLALCNEGQEEHCPERLKKLAARGKATEEKPESKSVQVAVKVEAVTNEAHKAPYVEPVAFVPQKVEIKEGEPVAHNVDLEALAYAISVAETSNCTAGTGKSRNNCHGIFGVTNGKYGPRTFAHTSESFAEFKRMWLRVYGDRFPTLKDAQKYTANEGTYWLRTVTVAYNRYRTNDAIRALSLTRSEPPTEIAVRVTE